jgi:hypothetical protein
MLIRSNGRYYYGGIEIWQENSELIDRLFSPGAVEPYCWQNMPDVSLLHDYEMHHTNTSPLIICVEQIKLQYKFMAGPIGVTFSIIPVNFWSRFHCTVLWNS